MLPVCQDLESDIKTQYHNYILYYILYTFQYRTAKHWKRDQLSSGRGVIGVTPNVAITIRGTGGGEGKRPEFQKVDL